MPSLSYAANELRRRRSRTILTALGLAAGVGLVMGIVGVSQGLDDAQQQVLSPLTSVGTDILVSRTVGATTTSASPSPSAPPAAPRGGFFGGGTPDGGPPGGGRTGGGANALASLNDADTTALLNENNSVVTDLAKLGKPGTKFSRDFFLPGTLLTFPQSAVDQVGKVDGVTSAVGGLTLLAQHQTGTVPNIVATVKTGGETLTSTVRPAELTNAERESLRTCIQNSGGFGGDQPPAPQPGASARPGGGRGGLGGFGGGAFEKCLPARFQEYNATVVAPLRTIQQVVNPPTTDTTSSSYTVAGVDTASPDAGLVTKAQLSAGSWFSPNAKNEVLATTAYATKKTIKLGTTLPINGTSYKVVGLVDPTLTGNTADLYFPLSTLQQVASKTDRVNAVLVKAQSADDVERVAADIRKLLPGAQVVTTQSLADDVTGSLHDAQQVASRLGGALAVIVLVAAFVIAALLTLTSISKRVREIGTLRALGWSRRRVVGQIVTENVGIGLLGGVVGIGVGYLVALAAHAFSPELSASSAGVGTASSVGQLFNQAAPAAVMTTVRLTAPISFETVALGMACALFGGLLAGSLGGWRASRLSPAVALRDLG